MGIMKHESQQKPKLKPYALLAWQDDQTKQMNFSISFKNGHVYNGAFVIQTQCLANVSIKLPQREEPLVFRFGYDGKPDLIVVGLNPELFRETETVGNVINGLKQMPELSPQIKEMEDKLMKKTWKILK